MIKWLGNFKSLRAYNNNNPDRWTLHFRGQWPGKPLFKWTDWDGMVESRLMDVVLSGMPHIQVQVREKQAKPAYNIYRTQLQK